MLFFASVCIYGGILFNVNIRQFFLSVGVVIVVFYIGRHVRLFGVFHVLNGVDRHFRGYLAKVFPFASIYPLCFANIVVLVFTAIVVCVAKLGGTAASCFVRALLDRGGVTRFRLVNGLPDDGDYVTVELVITMNILRDEFRFQF